MKKIIKKSLYVGVFICLSMAIISCEEDFTNIDTNVLTNTKFTTNIITEEVGIENSQLERIQTDNISRQLGQYLLGVYASTDYEKLEASVVSQLSIPENLKVVDNVDGEVTLAITKIDTVFLKLPYQVSLNSDGSAYELDSIIGDPSKAFTLNVYRSNKFLNFYNPDDVSKVNRFYSNDVFEKTSDLLNSTPDFPFIPSADDTSLLIKRRLFDDSVAKEEILELFNITSSSVQVPFARIPLDKDKFEELFLDRYETGEFDSQQAFNEYFKGVILEAKGTEGSLISFNFNNTNSTLNPSIEVYYTNTILNEDATVSDTIYKNDSFPLSGFRVNTFSMNEGNDKVYPENDDIIIQGAAGNEGDITLLTQDKIDELKDRSLLVVNASLILYVNQLKDIKHAPERLYLYKNNTINNVSVGFSQIKDAISESSFGGIRGQLERDENGNPEKYTFNLTDYVSDILAGNIKSQPLKLKVFNTSDVPSRVVIDTIFNNLSWNPKAVTLFGKTTPSLEKKPILKISYSENNN